MIGRQMLNHHQCHAAVLRHVLEQLDHVLGLVARDQDPQVDHRRLAYWRMLTDYHVHLRPDARENRVHAECVFRLLDDKAFLAHQVPDEPGHAVYLVEQELAFVMGGRLSGPSVNAADVIRATDFVLPALEVVDSRYSGRGKTLLVDSIADAASCKAASSLSARTTRIPCREQVRAIPSPIPLAPPARFVMRHELPPRTSDTHSCPPAV